MAAIASGGPKENSTMDGDFRRLRIREGGYIPTSSTDANGYIGEISMDSSYVYVKIAATTWRRIAHSSF